MTRWVENRAFDHEKYLMLHEIFYFARIIRVTLNFWSMKVNQKYLKPLLKYVLSLSTAQYMSITLLLFLYNVMQYRTRGSRWPGLFELQKNGWSEEPHIVWSLVTKLFVKCFPQKIATTLIMQFLIASLILSLLNVPSSSSDSKHFFQHGMCHTSMH